LRDSHVTPARCACAVVAGTLALAAPPAAGQPAGDAGGGAYVAKPAIAKVTCLRRCASRRRAHAGSILKVTGSGLLTVTEVVFQGSPGSGDDARVPVLAGGDTRLRVPVPAAAVSGPLALVTRDGVGSGPSPPLRIVPQPPPTPSAVLIPVPGPPAPGAPLLETGTSGARAYVDARRAVTFSFRVSGPAPASLTIELVSAVDGAVVKTWTPPAPAPGQVQSVHWSGRVGRATAAPGRYSFRLTAAAADGAVARSAQATPVERDAFDLYDHVFPIRGRHDFGRAGARFGAGRGGRAHEGHDTFAACGTPVAAARGGRVQYAGYHPAAGNYVVIDGSGTSVDYGYMHLLAPTPFVAGDRVYTGQPIGAVGQSGNARGCHLHFELWGAPGWYEGGRPLDPLPSLLAWDAWS
jgi:murein DD-endopeptidase MepM/ murein hydrolase activator NlpD